MSEHVHGCLNCKPDMVPDFDPADPRYHHAAKCGASHGPAMVGGVPVTYTAGVFEGAEGWALFCGATADEVHPCPNCATFLTPAQGAPYPGPGAWNYICVEPRFGRVEIDCPARRGTV